MKHEETCNFTCCFVLVLNLVPHGKGRKQVNPLKPTLMFVIFKNSARSSKRTQHFTITKINWLMLFKEIIAVYSEIKKPINTKCRVTDY
jgi:hypothetical protein